MSVRVFLVCCWYADAWVWETTYCATYHTFEHSSIVLTPHKVLTPLYDIMSHPFRRSNGEIDSWKMGPKTVCQAQIGFTLQSDRIVFRKMFHFIYLIQFLFSVAFQSIWNRAISFQMHLWHFKRFAHIQFTFISYCVIACHFGKC